MSTISGDRPTNQQTEQRHGGYRELTLPLTKPFLNNITCLKLLRGDTNILHVAAKHKVHLKKWKLMK